MNNQEDKLLISNEVVEYLMVTYLNDSGCVDQYDTVDECNWKREKKVINLMNCLG